MGRGLVGGGMRWSVCHDADGVMSAGGGTRRWGDIIVLAGRVSERSKAKRLLAKRGGADRHESLRTSSLGDTMAGHGARGTGFETGHMPEAFAAAPALPAGATGRGQP